MVRVVFVTVGPCPSFHLKHGPWPTGVSDMHIPYPSRPFHRLQPSSPSTTTPTHAQTWKQWRMTLHHCPQPMLGHAAQTGRMDEMAWREGVAPSPRGAWTEAIHTYIRAWGPDWGWRVFASGSGMSRCLITWRPVLDVACSSFLV